MADDRAPRWPSLTHSLPAICRHRHRGDNRTAPAFPSEAKLRRCQPTWRIGLMDCNLANPPPCGIVDDDRGGFPTDGLPRISVPERSLGVQHHIQLNF